MKTRYIAAEYRLSHWAQIVRERNESGLSVKAFCRKVGMHENKYFYWQKKLRETACEQLEKMQVDAISTSLAYPGFTEVKLLGCLPQTAHPEPVLHGNLTIMFSGVQITTDNTYPADQLAYLLRELKKQC